MEIAANIGAEGVIVQLGKGAAVDSMLSRVLCTLDKLLSPRVKGAVILYFEIQAAKQGAHTFETPAKVQSLLSLLQSIKSKENHSINVGVCIDTAHLYSCGTILDTMSAANEWLESAITDPNLPVMIHLNDSDSVVGSGKDKHQALCKGNIWGRWHPTSGNLDIETSGLAAIVKWGIARGSLIVLERNEEDIASDLSIIGAIITN
jgi:endonuclease IV